MAQADLDGTTTRPPIAAVSRTPISEMIRDSFVRAACKAAEDDGLAPDLVDIDRPLPLDGGAAEVAPDARRRTMVEA